VTHCDKKRAGTAEMWHYADVKLGKIFAKRAKYFAGLLCRRRPGERAMKAA